MPDYKGQLSEQEYDRALAHFQRFRIRNCPVSNDNNWILGDYLVHTPNHSGQYPAVGGPYYLYLPITCQTCGYTMLFNAVVVGLIPAGGG